MTRTIFVAASLLALAPPVAAAPRQVRLIVNKKGDLVVPGATLKALGVDARQGKQFWVEFPPKALPAGRRGANGHSHDDLDPIRLFTSVRQDGNLRLTPVEFRARITNLPGPPGTPWLATGKGGRLNLKMASPPKPAPKKR
jgi:hypothetical protein